MEKTYLSWNIVNWITVVLMSTIGVAAAGAIIATVRKRNGGGGSDAR